MPRASTKPKVQESCDFRPAGHVFTLPAPNGPTCIGVCTLCGFEREMRNSPEQTDWTGKAQKTGSTAGGAAMKRKAEDKTAAESLKAKRRAWNRGLG